MTTPVSRRRALGLGAAVASGAAAGSLGLPLRARASAATPPVIAPLTDPVSMAMHLHACFSEGIASMHAHLDQADRTGVDVIWWTEHDFRLQAHGYQRSVHFDGMTELSADGLEWVWLESQSGPLERAAGVFVAEPHTPDEPGTALRLTAVGSTDEWGRLQYEGTAWNSTYSTSIADTTVVLDVLAESVGADAEVVVEIVSSHRPATAGRPAGQYTLQYRIGAVTGRFTEEAGLVGVVASTPVAGWQRMRLKPAEDIAALWPDLVAGDASLHRLRVCVRARRGATAVAVVDRLRFRRSRRHGQQSLELQAELMAAYRSRYPGVRQYQGGELSLVRHLNRFGGEVFLPRYGGGPPFKDETIEAQIAMVDTIHDHGGLASYNHPLATTGGTAKSLARQLVETHNLGADILEVGSGDVEGVTFAFDAAARNGVFVTATGVSDDHAGTDWLLRKKRWITSTWAASMEEVGLTYALGAGRAWFADPAVWRGAMDISAQGRRAMGGVLISTDARVPLEVTATELPAESTLEIVIGEVDFAGPDRAKPAITTEAIPAAQVQNGSVELDLEPGAGRYLRAAVRDSAGALIGFSNPTWVLPTLPPGGVPPQRLL